MLNLINISVRSRLTAPQHSALQVWVALSMNRLNRLWKESGENISEVCVQFISFSRIFTNKQILYLLN